MKFDHEFTNVQKVSQMIDGCPVLIDFSHFSEDVQELLFEVHDHVDAIAGYADWYINRKVPTRIFDGAFLGDDFWKKLRQLKRSSTTRADVTGLRRIEEVAMYATDLTSLVFSGDKTRPTK